MVNRNVKVSAAAACICMGVGVMIWYERQHKTETQVIVVEKSLPKGYDCDALWLTDTDLLVIDKDMLARPFPVVVKAEIRNVSTGTVTPVPQLSSIFMPSRQGQQVWLETQPIIRSTTDRRGIRIWWNDEFTYIPVIGSAQHQHITWHRCQWFGVPPKKPISINGVLETPFAEDSSQAHSEPHALSSQSEWVVSFRASNAPEIRYRIGSDEGVISSIRTFTLPAQIATFDFQHTDEYTCIQVGRLTPEGHMLEYVRPNVMAWPENTYRALIEYAPGSPTPLHTYPVSLPVKNIPSLSQFDILTPPQLSPDGTKIAWLLPYPRKPDTRVTALLKQFHIIQAQPDCGVWVSDSHGGNMRMVSTWQSNGRELSNLDWTPNGHYITFQQRSRTLGTYADNALVCKVPVQ